jgi:hypothetical protein
MVTNAKLIEVIEVHTSKGKGVEGDPFRLLIQYWSKDGELLAEKDHWKWEKEEIEPNKVWGE